MEERAPPPPPRDNNDNNNNKSLITKPQLPNTSSGTYVVQVPKDQIYRIPPPENGRIAEQYRNSPPREKKRSSSSRCCCWCCVFIVLFIVILIFIGGILGGLFSIVLTPKDPRFSIQRFLLETKPHPQYNIFLQVHNEDSKVNILYKEGGVISLLLKRQKIASGEYPTFDQTHHNSTQFGVILKASSTIPKEVEESMKNTKDKVHVTFSLAIDVKAQMKMGLLRSGEMHYDVTCQVTVDTLAQDTRVLSQQCMTKRH